MARFEDAQAGWEIFKNSDYSATMDEINKGLIKRGYFPIRPRTYSHYFKLKRNGYLQYIPINQLDVKTLKDPFWDKAVRNRYTPLGDYVPVTIFFRIKNVEYTFHGTAVETSASSAVCRLSDRDAVALLKRKSVQEDLRRERVSMMFPVTGSTFVAYLEGIKFSVSDEYIVLSFGFVSLAAVDLMVERTPLPMTQLIIQVVPTTDQTAFSEIARKFYWLFQASESVRLACEDMLTQLDPDKQFIVPSTRIQNMQMRSPLKIMILFAVPIVTLMLMVVDQGVPPRKHRNKKPYEVIGSDRLKQLMDTTHQAVQDATGIQTSDGVSIRAEEIFREQLAPALLELFDEASGRVTLETVRTRDVEED